MEGIINCIVDCGMLCGDIKCNGDEIFINCFVDCKGVLVILFMSGFIFFLDFFGVVWLYYNVLQWEELVMLSLVIFEGVEICLNYDKSMVWFGVVYQFKFDVIVNVNFWIFIYQNGMWYVVIWEWLCFK